LEAGFNLGFFILCLLGAILAWVNKKYSGITLMLLNFMVWVFYLVIRPTRDAGMDVISISFLALILAAFLYRNWHVENVEKYRTNPNARLLLLDVLLINYSIIYLFVIIISVLQKITSFNLFQRKHFFAFSEGLDYLSLSGGLLIFAALIFVASLVILKKNRLLAGILLVLWYVLVVIINFTDQSFSRTGPWFILMVVVMINGDIYIKDAYQFRRRLAT